MEYLQNEFSTLNGFDQDIEALIKSLGLPSEATSELIKDFEEEINTLIKSEKRRIAIEIAKSNNAIIATKMEFLQKLEEAKRHAEVAKR